LAIVLPAWRDPHPKALDPIGAVLSFACLVAVVYAIIGAPDAANSVLQSMSG
jgi:hypothetical protein